MCGLVGIAGDLSFRDKDVVRTLLLLSQLRGEDSTGIAAVGSGTPTVIKSVGNPHELFALSAWDKLSLYSKKAIIGHTRKATVGKINKSTAHPFQYDHLTGVHNGTLQRWASLPCGAEETDSATAYKSMATIGVRETVERLAGAYAFIYWDESDETLNFLRNSQRPLWYAFSEDFKRIIWASERWMIHQAVYHSADWKLADLAPADEPPVYCVEVEVDTHFKLKIGAGKNPITFLAEEKLVGDVIKPEVKKYEPPFLLANRVGSNAGAQGQQSTTTTTSSSTSTVTNGSSSASPSPRPTLSLVPPDKNTGSSESKDSTEKSTVVLRPELNDDIPLLGNSSGEVLDIWEVEMDKEGFDKCEQSCRFCGTDVSFEDALEHAKGFVSAVGVGRWLDDRGFLCTKCYPAS